MQAQLKSRERMDYMGRYRDSLLWAAFDLQSRIYNILRGFEASRRPYSRGFLGAFLVEGTEQQARACLLGNNNNLPQKNSKAYNDVMRSPGWSGN